MMAHLAMLFVVELLFPHLKGVKIRLRFEQTFILFRSLAEPRFEVCWNAVAVDYAGAADGTFFALTFSPYKSAMSRAVA